MKIRTNVSRKSRLYDHVSAWTGVKPSPKPLSIREILVPTDFSEPSNSALKYALSFARQFDARVTLLHVLEPPLLPGDGFYPGPLSPDAAALATEQRIARMWEREKSRQPLRSMVRNGIPDREIVAVAKAEKMDLIILATHGRSGLAHVLLGSTAEKVIRQADCPVLVLRTQQKNLLAARAPREMARHRSNSGNRRLTGGI